MPSSLSDDDRSGYERTSCKQNSHDLVGAIVVYFLVLVAVFCLFFFLVKLTWWSSLNLALIIAVTVLLFTMPPMKIRPSSGHPDFILLYMLIVMVTIVFIIIYVFTQGLFDFRDRQCIRGESIYNLCATHDMEP